MKMSYCEMGKRTKNIPNPWRKNKVFQVKNHTLYNLMKERDISIQGLAFMISDTKKSVSQESLARRIQAWIYEGATPNIDYRNILEDIFSFDVFGEGIENDLDNCN